jgi:hypothetical protein
LIKLHELVHVADDQLYMVDAKYHLSSQLRPYFLQADLMPPKRVNRRYSLGKSLSNMPGFPLNQVGKRAKRVYFRIEATFTPVLFYPSAIEKGCMIHELTR